MFHEGEVTPAGAMHLLDVVLEGGGFPALASELEARSGLGALILTAELELGAVGMRARRILGADGVAGLERRLASLSPREARLIASELAASHPSNDVDLEELELPPAAALAARLSNRLAVTALLIAPDKGAAVRPRLTEAMLEEARHALAAEALRLQAARDAISGFRRQIVWEIALEGDSAPRDLPARAAQLGLSSRERYWLLLADTAADPNGLESAMARIARQNGVACHVTRHGTQLVLLAGETSDQPGLLKLAQSFVDEADQPDLLVTVAEKPVLLADTREIYRTLERTISVARSLRWTRMRVDSSAIRALSFYTALADTGAADDLLAETIAPLRAYDARTRRDLEGTLRAYLRVGGNLSAAARALYFDRRTVRQRLARVAHITACDPTTVDGRFILELATKIADMRQALEPQPGGEGGRSR